MIQDLNDRTRGVRGTQREHLDERVREEEISEEEEETENQEQVDHEGSYHLSERALEEARNTDRS